ncbi:MAG TPA: calcium-binding protein [Allosphingosinicella sp.]|uniref:calcium-binding protein n=1 Tax=Allosphingosinicella sp. TaxID=2823234 RepID=UPI002ED7928A
MATIIGTNNPETLIGTDSADEIAGLGGADIISAGSGDDNIYWTHLSDGPDNVDGGAGNDTQWAFMTNRPDFNLTYTLGRSGADPSRASFRNYDTPLTMDNIEAFTIIANMQRGGELYLESLAGTDLTGRVTVNALNTSGTATAGITFRADSTVTNQMVGFGTSLRDVFRGALGNDIFYGFDGDDELIGGSGVDELVGGRGNDTYSADAQDSLLELEGEGRDLISISSDYFVLPPNFEDLIGGGAKFTGIGNSGDNLIQGRGGNDYLIGMAGNDTLYGNAGSNTLQGGTGNDIYLIVESTGDSIVEFAGEGTDEIQTHKTSFTLPEHVENLTHTGRASFWGSGNAGDNVITGQMLNDKLIGHDGNDTLRGAEGGDILDGGDGNDVLIGGSGGDELGGGRGADRFVTSVFGDGVDMIHDFNRAQNDVIDIRALTASLGTQGQDPFASGVLSFQQVSDYAGRPATFVMFDPDGSAGPQGSARYLTVIGAEPLTPTDFLF